MSKSNDKKPKSLTDGLRGLLHRFGCTPAAQPTPQTPPAASPTVAPPEGQPAHSATPVRARRDAMEPSSRPVLPNPCETLLFEIDISTPTKDASRNAPIETGPPISGSADYPYLSSQCTSMQRYLENPTAPSQPVGLIPGGHNGPEVVIGFPGPETPPPAPTLNDRGRVPGNASIISYLELEASTASTPGEASTSNTPREAYMSNVPGEIVDHQVNLYHPYSTEYHGAHEDSENPKDHNVEDDQPDGAANGESSAKK